MLKIKQTINYFICLNINIDKSRSNKFTYVVRQAILEVLVDLEGHHSLVCLVIQMLLCLGPLVHPSVLKYLESPWGQLNLDNINIAGQLCSSCKWVQMFLHHTQIITVHGAAIVFTQKIW